MRGRWHGHVEEGHRCADCGIHHLHSNKHHISLESATASMGVVAWTSSDDLSRHSFIDGSDTSDLREHKKTKRLKITDVKEVV